MYSTEINLFKCYYFQSWVDFYCLLLGYKVSFNAERSSFNLFGENVVFAFCPVIQSICRNKVAVCVKFFGFLRAKAEILWKYFCVRTFLLCFVWQVIILVICMELLIFPFPFCFCFHVVTYLFIHIFFILCIRFCEKWLLSCDNVL